MVRWCFGGGDSVVIMVERGRYRNIHMYVMCTTLRALRSTVYTVTVPSIFDENNYLKVPPTCSLVIPKSKIYIDYYFLRPYYRYISCIPFI